MPTASITKLHLTVTLMMNLTMAIMAEARDLTTVTGLGMLLHQAPPGFEAWYGVKPTVDDAARDVMLAP